MITKKKLKYFLIFAALLGLQLVLLIIAGMQKDGFNIDDILSYLLSNSLYQPYLQNMPDFYNQWHTPDYLMQHLTAYSQSASFNYDSVTYNQILDVHPPLYYYALHTVCSLFTGAFSKWFGLGVNAIFFAGCSILLYLLGRLFFKSFYLRLLPLILWGFGISTFSTFLLIRMYMMLCFVTLLYAYLHLRFISGQRLSAWRVALALLCILIGFMTHYYFLIFAFFFVAGECLTRLVKKEFVQMLLFGIACSGAVGLGFAIYPAAYKHIFAEYQGKASVNNLVSISAYWARFSQAIGRLSATNCIAILCSIVILLCLLFLCFCPKLRKYLECLAQNLCPTECAAPFAKLFLISFATISTFVLVLILGGYTAERYLYYTYPLFALMLSITIGFCASALPLKPSKQQAFALIAALCFVGCGWIGSTPSYLEKESAAAIANAQANSDASCMIVLFQPYFYTGHFIELATYQETMLVRSTDFYHLADSIDTIDAQKLVLYLPEGSDTAEYFAYLKDNFGYTNFEPLWSYSYSDVYLLTP